MGHLQPPMPLNCNNVTMVGIANNTVKCQQSWSIEMRFFWVADVVEQGKFDTKYYPGKDYQIRHHIGTHPTAVCPWYLHEPNSARKLPRASKPSNLKGCVGTLPDGHIRMYPLPQVPTKQSVPTRGKRLPTYFGIPLLIPTLCRAIGRAIARVQTPGWFGSLNLTKSLC